MEKRNKKGLNGVKIFCGSTVILFLAVFVLSRVPGGADAPAAKDKDMQGTATESAASDMTGTLADDPAEDTGTEAVPATETEEERPEPLPDPGDADNTWAMFLVNAKNPVPEEYCRGIETAWVYESYKPFYLDSRASEFLKQMIAAADADGLTGNQALVVVSAYRTIEYQQQNFDNSVQQRIDQEGMTEEEAYADTLREVQLPGYSEHNSGVAVDIMCQNNVSMDDDSFKNEEAYQWLIENAADYGFILRYPEGKEDVTGIIYEPWHFRFVGVYYAKLLTDRGITLEEYFEEMHWVDENGVAVSHLPTLE